MTTLQTYRPSAPTSAKTNGPPHRPRWLRGILLSLFSLWLIYCLGIVLEGLFLRLPTDAAGTPAPGERIGILHVHTQASDGSGTMASTMAAGRLDDLSFMAITDHNVSMTPEDMAADPPDFGEISGEELTTSSGHFLALGIPPGWQRPKTPNADADLAAAHAAGAFTVIAHPFHNNIPWTDWKTSDFDGMEIWNEDEVWRRDHLIDLIDAMLVYGVNDRLALVRLAGRPNPNFAKWDELLAQRPVVGTCGADAHANIRLWRGESLHFPGYASVFLASREHVLLPRSAGGGDPGRADGAEILDALRHGHAFCALDALYPTGGFVSQVSGAAVSGGPGDSVALPNGGTMHVRVPSGAPRPLIKIIHNGKLIAQKDDWTLDAPVAGPGTYRTEVYLRQPGFFHWSPWALWIFSNPTYVTSGDQNPDPSPVR